MFNHQTTFGWGITSLYVLSVLQHCGSGDRRAPAPGLWTPVPVIPVSPLPVHLVVFPGSAEGHLYKTKISHICRECHVVLAWEALQRAEWTTCLRLLRQCSCHSHLQPHNHWTGTLFQHATMCHKPQPLSRSCIRSHFGMLQRGRSSTVVD